MSFLQYAQRLYSVDTLDTRFTTPAKALGDIGTPEIDPAKRSSRDNLPLIGNNERTRGVIENPPSLWGTAEYYLYYIIVGISVPLMFKAAVDVSKPSLPTYAKYEALLSPGWILGRKVDNSDSQYSNFRDNIPYMFIVILLHPALRKLFDSLYRPVKALGVSNANSHISQAAEADARMEQRIKFDVGFALVFLCALHGFSALKVLAILYANYAIATKLPRAYVPTVTWISNIGILMANELFNGYSYASIATAILPFTGVPSEGDGKFPMNWGSILDSYGGLVPRWEILFNFTVLRLISFNMDHYWSLGREGSSSIEKKQLDPSNLSERERVDIPARHNDYSFRNYIGYVLYSPLYLVGPVITFNDYISQTRFTPKSVVTSRIILYGIRFLVCLLTMEVMLHFIYVVAISKAQPAWEVYSPFQLSMLGYFNLHIIWLKLLLPWRFFRFWALLDSIDPPENMIRCMSNNYSAMAFWRAWHRSFSRWLTRYIYIPLGGNGTRGRPGKWDKVKSMINFLVVFTFVALWHDISMKLLVWGWLVTLFILPEVIATLLFPQRRWLNHPNAYRRICGIGAVGNILMMMAANLVGFALGLDGLQGLIGGILGSYAGWVFLATACVSLYAGAEIMFEKRQQEVRDGVKLRC